MHEKLITLSPNSKIYHKTWRAFHHTPTSIFSNLEDGVMCKVRTLFKALSNLGKPTPESSFPHSTAPERVDVLTRSLLVRSLDVAIATLAPTSTYIHTPHTPCHFCTHRSQKTLISPSTKKINSFDKQARQCHLFSPELGWVFAFIITFTWLWLSYWRSSTACSLWNVRFLEWWQPRTHSDRGERSKLRVYFATRCYLRSLFRPDVGIYSTTTSWCALSACFRRVCLYMANYYSKQWIVFEIFNRQSVFVDG